MKKRGTNGFQELHKIFTVPWILSQFSSKIKTHIHIRGSRRHFSGIAREGKTFLKFIKEERLQ